MKKRKKTFHAIQKTTDYFFSEHTYSEQYKYGTDRIYIAINAVAKLQNVFIQNIETFELVKMPNDTDFIKVNKDLNTLYSQIMKQTAIQECGTRTKAGIKVIQRKWKKYRYA